MCGESSFSLNVFLRILYFGFYLLKLSWSTDLMEFSHLPDFCAAWDSFQSSSSSLISPLRCHCFLFSWSSKYVFSFFLLLDLLCFTLPTMAIWSSSMPSTLISIHISLIYVYLCLTFLQSASPTFLVNLIVYLHVDILTATQT